MLNVPILNHALGMVQSGFTVYGVRSAAFQAAKCDGRHIERPS